jgi:hypothetical protein
MIECNAAAVKNWRKLALYIVQNVQKHKEFIHFRLSPTFRNTLFHLKFLVPSLIYPFSIQIYQFLSTYPNESQTLLRLG